MPDEIYAESPSAAPSVDPEPGVTPDEPPIELAPKIAPAPVPPSAPAPIVKPVASSSNRYDRLQYPPLALRRAVQGVVIVRFDVLEDGSTTNLRIVDGPAELHEVVLKAAARWRFTPATRADKPVRYAGMVQRVVFHLEDAEQ